MREDETRQLVSLLLLCPVSSEESLLNPLLVLLHTAPSVSGPQVQQVERVTQKTFLHLLVQWRVGVETRRVVYLWPRGEC